ncbi:exc-9 [Pristionchus pacificus]|nr:exc-9 [Pristionchus pacificus]
MPNCPRCTKPVYFAERVTSIGSDWHRPCLRCENEACKKTLAAGSHSEHDGKPYCNRCYGALFGPRGYGHGGVWSSRTLSTPDTLVRSEMTVPTRLIVHYTFTEESTVIPSSIRIPIHSGVYPR